VFITAVPIIVCVTVFITAGPVTKLCVFIVTGSTHYKAVCVGGIVEDMCYERRRAEACLD
jgi:hypothetical protein